MEFRLRLNLDDDCAQTGLKSMLIDCLNQTIKRIQCFDLQADDVRALVDRNGNDVGDWTIVDDQAADSKATIARSFRTESTAYLLDEISAWDGDDRRPDCAATVTLVEGIRCFLNAMRDDDRSGRS